jgi:hypothetical protein
MGFSLYLVFRNGMLRSTRGKRLFNMWLIFLVYLFVGAYIFYEMNRPLELAAIQEWKEFRANWTQQHACLLESPQDVDKFVELILSSANSGIVFAKNSTDFTQNWVFGGESIFFAFTLLATIGYGHATPLTNEGKIFTIFYITLGVPLSMIFTTFIVERLEFALTKTTTMSRISRGKHYERVSRGVKKYNSIGELKDADRQLVNESVSVNQKRDKSGVLRSMFTRTCLVGVGLLAFVYVGPALVFSRYAETTWSFLDALYYCFISVTTIGFGDYQKKASISF